MVMVCSLMDREFLRFAQKNDCQTCRRQLCVCERQALLKDKWCFWALSPWLSKKENLKQISDGVALLLHMLVHLIMISWYCCHAKLFLSLSHTPLFLRLVSKLNHPPASCLEPHAVLKQSYFPRQSSVIWEASGNTSSRASPQKLSPASWHCGRVKH